MVNRELRTALLTWDNREVQEFSEAPMLVRVIGVAVVSALTAIAFI